MPKESLIEATGVLATHNELLLSAINFPLHLFG